MTEVVWIGGSQVFPSFTLNFGYRVDFILDMLRIKPSICKSFLYNYRIVIFGGRLI